MTREEFVRFVDVPDRLERHLRAAAAVTRVLGHEGVQPVVVGGSAVEFYTRGAYTTADLDLIVPGLTQVGEALRGLGFEQRGASFWHPDLPLVIDLPPEPLAGDRSRASVVEVEGQPVYLIGLEDLIADRLRAAAYWADEESRELAAQLMAAYWEDLDWAYLDRLRQAETDQRYAAADTEARETARRLHEAAGGRW